MTRRATSVSLEGLRMLDAIDRLGSFAAAAQELFLVGSSITHTIHGMETSLGVRLFDRSGRKARFTREGRLLLDRGRTLLAQAAQFDADARSIATGWEPSLVIAVDEVLRIEPLIALADAFFAIAPATSLVLRREAAAGSWDALLGGRADLAIGAPGQGPAGGGYETRALAPIEFVFAAAPGHPLARIAGVVGDDEVARHRAVVIGDTTRDLPRLARGLLANRASLVVPDTQAKLDAILRGIACGFLPRDLARAHLRAKRLVVVKVAVKPPPAQSVMAWRAGENGRALAWWIERVSERRTAARLRY